MGIRDKVRGMRAALRHSARALTYHETEMLLLGKIMAENVKRVNTIRSLKDVEFKVFSQFGEDGIIQWLVAHVGVEHETFIEFGAEDYQESNTRFLLMNDNWSGLILDGSVRNMERVRSSHYFWKYGLTARAAFVDRENVNALVSSHFPADELGVLSIDIDGNDYWVWEAIDRLNPVIVVVEYNDVFGPARAITVPYDGHFDRTRAHHSNLYFGASLGALSDLGAEKGYALVGCNAAGSNAFFVRHDRLNEAVRAVTPSEAYVSSKLRQSRDESGAPSYLDGDARRKVIEGLPVFNTRTGRTEPF